MAEQRNYEINNREQPTILVVDDDPSLRLLVTTFLQQHGYQVHPAIDGQAAADLFYSEAGRIGLVLTDWDMPRKNGLELAQEVRALRPELPVILMSGNLPPEQRELAGMAFISKPFLVHTLLHEVEKHFKTK